MRNFLGFVILGIFAIASAARAEMIPVRSITVTGKAERKVIPDEAHVIVTIGATDMKMAVVKARHDAKLKKLFAIADKNRIERKHLTTQSSSVQPYYVWENNKQEFRGYRMQSSIDVKVADITKTADVVEQLMASGLEENNQQEYGQLINTSYTLSNPDKLREEMLGNAIRNARTKADYMAEAAGARIAGVYQINESEVPNYQPQPMLMMAKAAMAEGAAGDQAVAPPTGEQDLRSSVTVIFELR